MLNMNESEKGIMRTKLESILFEIEKSNSCPVYIREKLNSIESQISRIESYNTREIDTCKVNPNQTYKDRAIDRAYEYCDLFMTYPGDIIIVRVFNREETYTKKFRFIVEDDGLLTFAGQVK